MLNAAVLAFNAAGQIITIEPGSVLVQFNGGTPTGLLGALQAVTIGSRPHNGLNYDDAGHLAVANDGIIAGYAQGGMPVDLNGKVCVAYDIAVSYWNAGLPFTSQGRLACVTPAPPQELHAFDDAFSLTEFD